MSAWPKDVPLSRERWNERYKGQHSDAIRRTEELIPGSKVIVQEEEPEK